MKECINCTERHLACQDSCKKLKANLEQKHRANERYRELNSSVGWDGYLKVREIIRR